MVHEGHPPEVRVPPSGVGRGRRGQAQTTENGEQQEESSHGFISETVTWSGVERDPVSGHVNDHRSMQSTCHRGKAA